MLDFNVSNFEEETRLGFTIPAFMKHVLRVEADTIFPKKYMIRQFVFRSRIQVFLRRSGTILYLE